MRIVAVTLVALATLPAFGSPPSPESIDRLLTAMQVEKNLQQAQEASERIIRGAATQRTAGRQMSADDRQRMDATVERIVGAMRQEMSIEKMRPETARLYAETFTQEEVDGLIAFYQGPTGRAFVAKMPTVMQKSMQVMREHMDPMMRRLDEELMRPPGSAGAPGAPARSARPGQPAPPSYSSPPAYPTYPPPSGPPK